MRIVESPDCAVSERCENKHFPSGALLLVRLCFHPRSNSDHLLPVTQCYTHRVTETRAPSCDQTAGAIHRLNPEREIAKAKAENESWSLKPSPMFWYQSAVYAQFYYFDGFSVVKKKWGWELFWLYIIVKEKELVKIGN